MGDVARVTRLIGEAARAWPHVRVRRLTQENLHRVIRQVAVPDRFQEIGRPVQAHHGLDSGRTLVDVGDVRGTGAQERREMASRSAAQCDQATGVDPKLRGMRDESSGRPLAGLPGRPASQVGRAGPAGNRPRTRRGRASPARRPAGRIRTGCRPSSFPHGWRARPGVANGPRALQGREPVSTRPAAPGEPPRGGTRGRVRPRSQPALPPLCSLGDREPRRRQSRSGQPATRGDARWSRFESSVRVRPLGRDGHSPENSMRQASGV